MTMSRHKEAILKVTMKDGTDVARVECMAAVQDVAPFIASQVQKVLSGGQPVDIKIEARIV